MYGLINRFVANPGRRDELVTLIIGEETAMDGCRSYVVARDLADPDAVWVGESEAQWAASMDMTAVTASIEMAVSLIASFGERIVTEPAGSIGL